MSLLAYLLSFEVQGLLLSHQQYLSWTNQGLQDLYCHSSSAHDLLRLFLME
jgi:hypothetical protein